MRHDTPIVGTVPMGRAWRRPHNIPHREPLRLAALIADPARADLDLQNLPVLVGVPERAGARRECHVGDHDALVRQDWVRPHFARECCPALLGRHAHAP